jgi:hypothetical protein
MTDRPTTQPGDDPRVVSLSREVERATREAAAALSRVGDLGRELDAQRELLRELAGSLASLARSVAGTESPEDGSSRAWLQVSDGETAREVLADLVGWLDEVYLRYPDASLPSCWAWHPNAIEELWWLRNAHRDAYSGKAASWAKAGDWHDRQRPGVVKRLDALVGCALEDHKPDGLHAARAIAAPLAGHLELIADAWTTTGLPPAPTDAQVDEAEQYDAMRNSGVS